MVFSKETVAEYLYAVGIYLMGCVFLWSGLEVLLHGYIQWDWPLRIFALIVAGIIALFDVEVSKNERTRTY